ncbi:MAG: hypothetical protein PVH74_17310 [Desulfobacterales bacterium]
MISYLIRDRGGTRSGTERRRKQTIYMQPDRRSGKDRRSGSDRRASGNRYLRVAQRHIFFLHEN